MIGLYFSGTGNTRYCVETFLKEYDADARSFSIEEEQASRHVKEQEEIVFGYSVQYSNIPKMVQDYIADNSDVWQGKKVFVIATMGMFSGDGAGMLARLLAKHGAVILGGLHLKMPDSICDVKVLKKTLPENQRLVKKAEQKTKIAANRLKSGNPTREGLGIASRLAGLLGQRLYFYHMTRKYLDKLKINADKCIGCGKCADLCPMKNIYIENGKAAAGSRCTMCYRCINNCPVQAVTLLGKSVIVQGGIEKYLQVKE